MARSPEEIRKSLIKTITTQDRTIDITNGPVYDTVILPIPEELSISEMEALRASKLHSPSFISVATVDDINTLRTNMRLPEGSGEKAKGLQLFWANSIKDDGIVIPKGTIVSTKDGKYSYVTTEDKIITSANKEAYYNTINFRYEVIVGIEAIAAGTEYNIPIGRINNMISEIDSIDGTINYSTIEGGTENESSENTVLRIQEKFMGLDKGTTNGLSSTYIRGAYPTLIDDVSIIRPNSGLFKRPVRRSALDVYVSGEDLTTYTQTYVITETDTQLSILKIKIAKQPVVSITQVTLDEQVLQTGTGIKQYQYAKDTSILFNSYRANDEVWITNGVSSSQFQAGQKITITYVADALVINLQEKQFNSNTTLFDTDVLCRKAIEGEIVIEMVAKFLTDPSDERSRTLKADLESTTFSYIENGMFGRSFNPETVRQDLKTLSPNVVNIYLKTFRRKNGAYRQIEPVELIANEIPKIYEEDGIPFSITLMK